LGGSKEKITDKKIQGTFRAHPCENGPSRLQAELSNVSFLYFGVSLTRGR